MKGIDKRINQDGNISYRARVRVKGHPPVVKTFISLTIAKKWKKDTEVEIEKGRYFDKVESQKHTLSEAIHRAGGAGGGAAAWYLAALSPFWTGASYFRLDEGASTS